MSTYCYVRLFWECFSWFDPGLLVHIKGNATAYNVKFVVEVYKEMV